MVKLGAWIIKWPGSLPTHIQHRHSESQSIWLVKLASVTKIIQILCSQLVTFLHANMSYCQFSLKKWASHLLFFLFPPKTTLLYTCHEWSYRFLMVTIEIVFGSNTKTWKMFDWGNLPDLGGKCNFKGKMFKKVYVIWWELNV